MSWGTLLLIAFIMVCPISMWWMMRHGRQGGDHNAGTRVPRGTMGNVDRNDDPTHRLDSDRDGKIETRQHGDQ